MLGFLIAAGLGYLTPKLVAPLGTPVVKALQNHIKIAPEEKRLITFMLAMLIAAIVAVLIGSGTPFWIMVGGVLGYFGSRIFAAVKKIIDDRSASGDA